jgi:hypothetical protein
MKVKLLLIIFSILFLSSCKQQKSFCPKGLIYGDGKIDYCMGKPFICDYDECYYIQKNIIGEQCHNQVIFTGKTTIVVRKCNEVFGN